MNTEILTPAESYVRTINGSDAAAFIDLFADDALVDDAGREFRGRDAIKSWSDHDIFAANVTLQVTDETEHDGATIITSIVDGNFDRTGLPDPVIITHRIKAAGNKITAITCRLANAPLT
jgi:hypothetical protein